MPHEPKSIANYFIELAAADGKKLTPLKLIKLVYLAHGWHLGLTGQPLINEPPEAWRFGPVIPSLYHALKHYGNEPITGKITDYQLTPGPDFNLEYVVVLPPAEPAIRDFLADVWKAYGHLSALQLSALTHQPGTPWYEIWERQGARYSRGVDIPEESIIQHYRELNAARPAQSVQPDSSAVASAVATSR